MKCIRHFTFSIIFLAGSCNPLFSQLIPDFTSDTTEGCAPLVIKFSDKSTGNPVSWKWEMGNGSILFVKDPATTYLSPGTYTVRLTVDDGNGEKSVEKVNYIRVHPTPITNFNASTTTGCFPLPVKFIDESIPQSGSLIKWEWDFGDGFTSDQKDPVYVYNALGSYHVVLRVTNSHGCTQTLPKLNYIKISTGAIADFTLSSPNNCNPPTSVSFIDSSTATGTLTYKWDFGDGSTSTLKNPKHTYTQTGSYPVSLTVTNDAGCVNQVIKPNAVNIGTVTSDFIAPDTVCAGAAFTIQNTSNPSPTGARWNFGNGDTSAEHQPSYSYPSEGKYSITLESDFGVCRHVAAKQIVVLDKPRVNFTTDKRSYCAAPFSVPFIAQTAETLSYQWDFGDGNISTERNPVHVYQTDGIYNVSLIATNSIGCTETIMKDSFIVIKRPRVTFDSLPSLGCLPHSVRPNAHIGPPETISTYRWIFGDGKESTAKKPVHTYTTPGKYIIKLVYTTGSGCVDSAFTMEIEVGNKPNLDFTASPTFTCAFKPVSFTDISSSPATDKWRWEFGDGESSELQNPNHNFSDTGVFDVKLVAWSSGCADTLVKEDIVHITGPVAKFTDSISCGSPYRRWFRDRSIDAAEWFWDFGDGTTSTLQNPEHTYQANGDYIVRLTVANDTCQNTTYRQIFVHGDKKDFSANTTNVCTNVPVSFSASGVSGTDPAFPLTILWDFGDGTVISGQGNIEHIYSLAGTYNVTMVVSNILGCTDTVKKPLYINVEGPHAGFTTPVETICASMPIVFNDTSSASAAQPIISWVWDYGDGVTETKTGGPFQHTYNEAGTYSVVLKVTDVNGCSSQAIQYSRFTISAPTSSFESPDPVSCTNKPVRFINNSTGNINKYEWTLGNGITSTLQQPTIEYDNEGMFDVQLITTDIIGCSDTLLQRAYIKIGNPKALFMVSDSVSTCPPLVIDFENRSENYISYEWDFGDNTRPAPTENPTHFYALPGTYVAKLRITSAGGCVDSMSQKLIVSGPEGRFTYDVINGCNPVTIRFTGETLSDASFVWDYNDGSVEPGGSEITHTYTETGVYLPKMILVDPQGCRVPFPGLDSIRVFGVEASFTADTEILCDSGLVKFTNMSTSNEEISGFNWKFADGSESTEKDPSHFYRSKGEYQVELVTTSRSGCKDTLLSTIPVKIAEKPQIDFTGDTLICMPGDATFTGLILNNDSSALSWNWNFGNGSTASVKEPVPVIFREVKNYDVQVVAVSPFGCTDTVTKTIRPLPLPTVNAGEDKTITSGSTVQLTGSHSPDVISLKWDPETDLSCSECKDPLASPMKNTTYTFEVTNAEGCTNKDQMTITVFCNEGNLFMPNTFSPNGDGVNDVFYPRGQGLFSVRSLRIFNRWGEIVFERKDFSPNDKSRGWDGTYNNRQASQDVYVYSIDIVCDNNTILNHKGNVALIR